MRIRPRTRDDAGESLIELMISTMIIGTTVVAVVGGVLLVVGTSGTDQRQTQALSYLRSWAEGVAGTDTDLTGCPIGTPAAGPLPTSMPAGFTPVVEAVQYWDPAAKIFVSPSGSCGGTLDPTLRKLTLRVALDPALYPYARSSALEVVVRTACAAPPC